MTYLGQRLRLTQAVHGLGPYAAIALFLPGGSLIALALLIRRFGLPISFAALRTPLLVAMLGTALLLPGSV